MNAPSVLTELLEAAREIVAASDALAAFAPWPDGAEPAARGAAAIPALEEIAELAAPEPVQNAALQDAILRAADAIDWRQTYTEEEVGRHFLDHFGYCELIGPEGHFLSQEYRAFIAYWGEGLHYDWHVHEAEELYFIVSGEAEFFREGEAGQVLRAGDTRLHRPMQPHAMTTGDSPVLAFILWRGSGVAELPRMGRE